jgi:hypothetical protein
MNRQVSWLRLQRFLPPSRRFMPNASGLLEGNYSNTVAGPLRIRTGFPIKFCPVSSKTPVHHNMLLVKTNIIQYVVFVKLKKGRGAFSTRQTGVKISY